MGRMIAPHLTYRQSFVLNDVLKGELGGNGSSMLLSPLDIGLALSGIQWSR